MNDIFRWIGDHGLPVAAIIFVTFGLYIGGVMFMDRIVKRALHATKRDWHEQDIKKRQRTLVALFKNIWRAVIVTTGTLIILHELFPDVSLAPIFASAGIIGIALGFGAQSLVQDFTSGLFIISENQYRVGDIIDIEGASGTVERIGVRTTVLRDADGNVHYFPNGMVKHVINKTMGFSMARFTIAIHPSSDIDEVVGIINETGAALAKEPKWKSKIIEAPSFVSIGDFTASSVGVLIAGKTQPSDQWAVTAEMRRRLLLTLETRNVELGVGLPAVQTSKK
jgi:small conductance mechanosensitive channel